MTRSVAELARALPRIGKDAGLSPAGSYEYFYVLVLCINIIFMNTFNNNS